MRAWLARALVRWVSRWLDAAFHAYARDMHRWESMWALGARTVGRFALPLAHQLDTEAAVTQMIHECWWG